MSMHSQEPNAGLRRTDGSLASALGNLAVGHQSRHSEHLRSDKATLSELQRHIGRLEEKIEANKVSLLAKDREISDLTQANANLHDDLTQNHARLREVETEKQLLLRDIGHLHDEIDSKNGALKKLNEDLAKAQKTIKVQSDQIAGGKDAAKPQSAPKPHSTPQRFGPAISTFGKVYREPPPSYNATNSRFPQVQPSNPALRPSNPALRRQQSTLPSFQPHPQPMFGAQGNQNRAIVPQSTFNTPAGNRATVVAGPISQPTFNAPAGQNRGTVTAAPVFNPFQSQQGVLVHQNQDQASGVNLIAEFTPFFYQTETWARNYVSIPNQNNDLYLTEGLRNALSMAVDPRTAMKLISASKTRPLLIARVINQVIVDFAFRPMLLRGFTAFYDNKISSFRGQLMGNIPASVRRGLLLACAETVVDMTQANGFEEWMDYHIVPYVHEMWHLLQPLFAHGTPRDPAWIDLNRIWKEATRIGILMLSKPCIYTLDFPPMGPSSYFNPSNMCNRDEDFTQNPHALGSMAVSVRLAITPIVTETDFMKDAIEAKCLHQSMVLLSF